jgi:hypothetical protein
MSIWAAAGAIVGVACAAFAFLSARIAYREVRYLREHADELQKQNRIEERQHEDQHAHVGI